ncbi:shikimate kinase [Lachnospiraceae bacterium XPB1003]|nr:shikimate kinase [Lachnospiraceae bacterium XPB1003]
MTVGNIILTGYMGSGKSTVSRELEKLTGLKMLDTDARIEQDAGKSITRIFAEEGEDAFRDMETELLNELLRSGFKGILSTGGGMPVRRDNRILMSRLGAVFYLKASPETICNRLVNDTTRPLLAGETKEGKLEKIKNMLEMRKEAYESGADHIIITDGVCVKDIASEILKAAYMQ